MNRFLVHPVGSLVEFVDSKQSVQYPILAEKNGNINKIVHVPAAAVGIVLTNRNDYNLYRILVNDQIGYVYSREIKVIS